MGLVRRCVLALVLTSAVLAVAAGPAVAESDGTAPTQQAVRDEFSFQTGERPDINLTQQFGLTPETPGRVSVRLQFAIPDRVRSLRTQIPVDAQVTDTRGFERKSNRQYHWDKTTELPSLTYSLPVNETRKVATLDGVTEERVSVDAGDWALFQRPTTPTNWTYVGDRVVGFNRDITVDGPGATGEWFVYLGSHEEYERTAYDQHFRVIIPSSAEMASRPERVLDSIAEASNALRVGDRDEEVFVVAAPSEALARGSIRGLQVGDADMWVRDTASVDSPENVWIHEYVHSRQQFRLDSDMKWFHEATASYYAALLTLEQERITYEEFQDELGAGAQRQHERVVLANRSTWAANSQYTKGALIAGQLDRQIRDASDREQTLQSVFRRMNEEPGRTSLSDFLQILAEAGDEDVVDAGRQYAGTASSVSTWNRTAHVRTFGTLPARVGVQLPTDANDATYEISGPYRRASVSTDEPLVLVPSERLQVDAVVSNAGGTAGDFNVSLDVNDTVVDYATGAIAVNGSTIVTLEHTFETTGAYQLRVGSANATVRVVEPTVAQVTNYTVAERTVRQGDVVTVSAVVRNNASVPSATDLKFLRNEETVATRRATVGPGYSERVHVRIPMIEAGTTSVRVGEHRPVQITVEPLPNGTVTPVPRLPETPSSTPTDRPTESAVPTTEPVTGQATDEGGGLAADQQTAAVERTTSGAGPGFGVETLAVGVVLALAVIALRRS